MGFAFVRVVKTKPLPPPTKNVQQIVPDLSLKMFRIWSFVEQVTGGVPLH
jgi:hypothetical protein